MGNDPLSVQNPQRTAIETPVRVLCFAEQTVTLRDIPVRIRNEEVGKLRAEMR